MVHRIIWKMMTGEDPDLEIDHVNGSRADNSWANLRPATHTQNSQNKRLLAANRSGFKGVSFDARKNRRRASIRVNRKKVYLGYFVTREEASEAYLRAAEREFGAFAKVA
jgi:hypothetical protein